MSSMNQTSYEYQDDEARHLDGNTSNVLIAKAVTMAVLCTVSICMGILPMQLAKWFKWNTAGHVDPRSTKLVSLLLGFGGGVLFCTTFLHLLPEVTEGVDHLVEESKLPKLGFSLAETLACTGFFIMYFVEECVHTHLRRKQADIVADGKKDVNRSTNELVENGQTVPSCVNGHAHIGHSHLPVMINNDKDDFVITSLRGLLIVLGLSVHELFEGLAIGLESSSNYVWYMFAAVAAHKFVIAFCIGVQLIASRTRRYLSIIYVCTFAVVSPIGIGVGMLLVGGGSAAASGPMAVILQGLASGTLLYVVFFEILQERRSGLTQYFSILIGFAMMFGLQMLTAHSHSHGGHGHSHSHNEHHHDDDDDDHDEEDNSEHHHMDHLHSHSHNRTTTTVFTDAIDQVTDRIAEVLSNAIANTTTASPMNLKDANDTNTLHHRHS